MSLGDILDSSVPYDNVPKLNMTCHKLVTNDSMSNNKRDCVGISFKESLARCTNSTCL